MACDLAENYAKLLKSLLYEQVGGVSQSIQLLYNLEVYLMTIQRCLRIEGLNLLNIAIGDDIFNGIWADFMKNVPKEFIGFISTTGTKEEVCSLLKRFYFLQTERVETYELFDEGHAAYLNGGPDYNFHMYKQLVSEITQTFKKISDEIIDIEGHIRTIHNLENIAVCIRNIQEEEQKKLELTAELQIAKQNLQDHPDKCNEYENEIKALKTGFQEMKQRINEHLEELKYESEDIMTI